MLFSRSSLRREPQQDGRTTAGRCGRHPAGILAGILALLAVMALGPLGPDASAAATAPAVTDLGTLGGPFSQALAVSGDIVAGDSTTASGADHAFAYDLGPPRVPRSRMAGEAAPRS